LPQPPQPTDPPPQPTIAPPIAETAVAP
jgi:hypothetical protein